MALDGAFLPGAVGVAVVDGGAEEGFERVFVEGLGAVVGEQGLELVAVGAEVAAETAERGGHGVLGERREGVQVEAAGFRGGGVVGVDECQEAVAAVGGVDGVHLEVAGLGVVPRGGGKIVDQVFGGVVAGWVGGAGGEVVAAGEVEAVAPGDDLEAAVQFLQQQDGLGGDGLELALERLALDDAGAGVGLGLELLDVAVDLDLVEGDVVDLDVGVAQQVVEGKRLGGACADWRFG